MVEAELPDAERRLGLQEAASRLGVHYMTVYRYVRLGRLPAVKEGGVWKVPEQAVARFGTEGEGARREAAPWERRLESRMVEGDTAGAWGVVEAALAAGTEPAEVYSGMLAPALTAIGERWERGELGVGDEHLASAVAARLIGRLGPRFARRGRPRGRVVTAAPAGERHWLGLAMLADVVRGRGYEVVDLGPDTPAAALQAALHQHAPCRAVCLSVVWEGALAAAARMVEEVRSTFPGLPILLGGWALPFESSALELGADGWAPDLLAAASLVERVSSR